MTSTAGLLTNSALPVLRQLGLSKEGRELFKDEDQASMIKVWLALELRQVINASVQDVSDTSFYRMWNFTNCFKIHQLVKADMLSPNY